MLVRFCGVGMLFPSRKVAAQVGWVMCTPADTPDERELQLDLGKDRA